jgi:hypothetical protein
LRDAVEQLLEANRQVALNSALGKNATRETMTVSVGQV